MSLGNRGNVVNFSPRSGIRHTVGIPGTGLSWSSKLSGQPARPYADGKINTLAQANLAIAEATFAKAALAFEKAAALTPQMSEELRAELEIRRATELAKHRLNGAFAVLWAALCRGLKPETVGLSIEFHPALSGGESAPIGEL